MALRAVKPTTIEKRMKALFYGGAGAGKTTAAISFPRPYLIDTEKGATNDQYVKLLEKNGGAVFQTCDFDELLTEVKSLLSEKHDYKTLIIDPLTTLYHDLLEKSAIKRINEKDPDGTAFGGHYGLANKKIKQILGLLTRLDMNVLITSHSKVEYSGTGKDMVVTGTTFDCYKKLDYLFDLVFEVQKRGKDRVALVKKTRVEGFPEGDIFPFSYDEIATRYGKEILERQAEAIKLATPDQVIEIERLIDLLKVPSETVDKWMKKAESESFDEMNFEYIQKCIEFLKKQITGAA